MHYAFSSLYWKPVFLSATVLALPQALSPQWIFFSMLSLFSVAQGARPSVSIKPSTFSLNRISTYIFHIDHSTILRMTSHNSLCVCHTVAVSLPSLVEKDIVPPTCVGLKQSQLLLLFTENKTCIHSWDTFLWNNITFLFNWNMPLKMLCVSQRFLYFYIFSVH